MNNPTERPPSPDHEALIAHEPVSVEPLTRDAVEVRVEKDKEKIEALRTELVQPSAEATENARTEERAEKPIEAPLPSSSKLPRILRKAVLLAGMLGLSFGGAQATEDPTKGDKGKKTEKSVESKESITDQLRQDWNDYVDWLEKKGLKGDAKLDEGDLGLKMIDQYRAEHPETTVSNKTVQQVQEAFEDYKEWVVDQVKQGKAAFAPGVTEETFMKSLSDADGYAGSLTTAKKFPAAYLQTIVDGASRTVKYAEFSKADTFIKNK